MIKSPLTLLWAPCVAVALSVTPTAAQQSTGTARPKLSGPSPVPLSPPGNVGTGTDADGDGLTDEQEIQGWLIVVDETGFGIDTAVIKVVFSDPSDPDSDDDGLDDFVEYAIKTDPNDDDTDNDQLTDAEEWQQWLTSPTSVDTDADARGPGGNLSPNPLLFDGFEVNTLGTSPTLADTDGDSRTDFEELGSSFFHPLIAELPTSKLDVVGDLDVRLNVEYSETVGQSIEYGTEFSKSTSSSQALENSSSSSMAVGAYWEESIKTTVSVEADASVPPSGKTSVSTELGFTYGTSIDVAKETGFSMTSESAKESGESYSQYFSDSTEMTETSSSGTISMGIQLVNDGLSTFTLTNLGVTVLKFEPPSIPGAEQGFKVMGTLTPALSQVTLAPGQGSPVLQVSSTDVDAAVIKSFLSNPSSLILQPSVFDMTNADGIDFDFITENTFTQTALVEIDFGAGQIESYRVATNARRDASGNLAGVTMQEVLNDILGIAEGTPGSLPVGGYTVEEKMVETAPGSGVFVGTGLHVLASVKGKTYTGGVTEADPPTAFWTVISNTPNDPDFAGPIVDFNSIRVDAGDSYRLAYTRDQDGDGLYEIEEAFYGTNDLDDDTDGDELLDADEVKVGWMAGVNPVSGTTLTDLVYPKMVYSDPRFADSDGDGLDDNQEKLVSGTDPLNPDTDSDGLDDLADPFPLIPANTVYARVDGDPLASGLSWDDAQPLATALATAVMLNQNGIPSDDVSVIWVAQGLHTPVTASNPSDRTAAFMLPDNVTVYGGFVGSETILGERDPNPLTNQTLLSGNIGILSSDADNSYSVVWGPPGGSGALDGFTVMDGNADVIITGVDSTNSGGGLFVEGEQRFRNLLIYNNQATQAGAGAAVNRNSTGALFDRCTILANGESSAGTGFGGMRGAGLFTEAPGTVLLDCQVSLNTASNTTNGSQQSAGIYAAPLSGPFVYTPVRLERTQVSQNSGGAGIPAGGLFTAGAMLLDCELVGNFVADGVNTAAAGMHWRQFALGLDLVLLNCRFWGNAGGRGAISADNDSAIGASQLHLLNSTVVGNTSSYPNMGGLVMTGGFSGPSLFAQNSVLWGNRGLNGAGNQPSQLNVAGNTSSIPALNQVQFTCVEGLGLGGTALIGVANIGLDPQFVSEVSGNLRLKINSPCIDAGFNIVDTDPAQAGIQPLPPIDLDGNPRIVDGSGAGSQLVDMGAYEYQP